MLVRQLPPAAPQPLTDTDPGWLRLVAAQHGTVNLRQLRELGVARATLRAHLDARRWRHVLPRVYATFTGPLPRDSLVAAALLYGEGWAVLSHRTAAEEWGLLPVVAGPVHITVPYGCSAVSQPPLVVVHRSRAFPHIVVDRDRPVTGRADTVIDLAVAEPTAREAMRTLTALLADGRVRLPEVHRRSVERPPRRYRTAIAAALRRLADGVQSVLEEAYAVDVEQAHGLPGARRQAPVVVDGRTLYEDAVYDDVGVPLTVRLDGRTHLMAEVARRDRRRDNAAEIAGRSRLSFGWHDVRDDPCGVAREVATVLRRRGWPGAPRVCGARECGGSPGPPAPLTTRSGP